MTFLLHKSILLIVTVSVALPMFTLTGIVHLYNGFCYCLISSLMLVDYINLVLSILVSSLPFCIQGEDIMTSEGVQDLVGKWREYQT